MERLKRPLAFDTRSSNTNLKREKSDIPARRIINEDIRMHQPPSSSARKFTLYDV